METTKLLGGKTNILSHGSTHSNAIDMGPPANERGRQTTYTIRRLDYLEVILTTWCRGEVVSPQLSQGSAPNHRISLSPEISQKRQLWAATDPPTGLLGTWNLTIGYLKSRVLLRQHVTQPPRNFRRGPCGVNKSTLRNKSTHCVAAHAIWDIFNPLS